MQKSKTDTDILQGSVVRYMMCGGMFNDHFVARLLLSVPVKVF